MNIIMRLSNSNAKVVLDNGMDPEDYDIYFREGY